MAAVDLSRFNEAVRKNAWWTLPSLAVALGLGYTFGLLALWLGYAAFNIVGVWFYIDHHGSHRSRRQLWMKRLAIPLLPVGFLNLLFTSSSHPGVGEENIRHETAIATSEAARLGQAVRDFGSSGI